ncbi:MarR family winged helix-turn-helix transcriptional regulator [Nocardia concava]|uniref:MarR family winged helix-turn-helix transcriptional regulator n=1 Tax=Nocardia concava TaxID=257281 RepID=UPI0002EEE516|nr:MarR family winged helix-turn-helix transcriptional regulator [Nocardia concava]
MSASDKPIGASEESLPPSVQSDAFNHAILRVARLHRMLAAQLLRRVGLYPGQELVMMQLWDRGPQRQADLVRMLGSDAATMTRTVQRLEHAGFVRRTPSPDDKRATIIESTAAGLALRGQVEALWAELEQRTTAGLTAEQRAAVIETLDQVARGLARATEKPD